MDEEFEPITRKHERKLIKRAQAGLAAKDELAGGKQSKKLLSIIAKGIEARNELLIANNRWVHQRTKYWAKRCPMIDYDDLYSESVLGMCKAIDLIDLDRDIRLTTYSWWVMNTTIRRFIRKNHLIRPKVDSYSKPLKIVSFAAKFSDSSDEVGGSIPDVKAKDPTLEVMLAEEEALVKRAAEVVLNDKQRDVFYRKFHGASIDEIAKSLRVTTSSIGQTYNRALYKLTKYFENAKAC